MKSLFVVIAIVASVATSATAWENIVTLNLGDNKTNHTVRAYSPNGNGLNFDVNSSGFSSEEIQVNGIGCYYNPKKVEIIGVSCASKTYFVVSYKVKDTDFICSEILDLEDEDFTKFARTEIKGIYFRENGNTKGFDEIPLTIKVGKITFLPYAS